MIRLEFYFWAVVVTGITLGLGYFSERAPVTYARLVAEDGLVESSTAIAFLFAATIAGAWAIRTSRRARRGPLLALALSMFVIAAEEISWGQRIFGLPTPSFMERFNYQNELTIHNMEFLVGVYSPAMYLLVGGVLGWFVISSVLWFIGSERPNPPVVSPALWPLALAIVGYIFWSPLMRSVEVGELFIGLTAVFAATDLCARRTGDTDTSPLRFQPLMLAAVAMLGLALSWLTQPWPDPGPLHAHARFADPARADELYEFIYACGWCERPTTRLAHARVLAAGGDVDGAALKLSESREKMPAADSPEYPEFIESLIAVQLLLGQQAAADATLAQFVTDHEAARADEPRPDTRARMSWNIARALFAGQRHDGSIRHAETAIADARSQTLKREVRAWLEWTGQSRVGTRDD